MSNKVSAVIFTRAGGPEVIELGTVAVRAPGAEEVTVEIAAAGVNRADVLQRRGHYPAPAGAPADVPGLEFAGTVVACGANAQRFSCGAAVMGIVAGGAMAQRVTLHERELMRVPAGLSLQAAAAIPEAFLTAWDAMRQAGLGPGHVLLVHAAASGVGTAALQLARWMQVRALATTRTQAKLTALAAFGLQPDDGIVVGAQGGFAPIVKQRVARGVDMVLDCVGGNYLADNVAALAPQGTMVMLGAMGGATGALPIGQVLAKRVRIVGSVMRARGLEEKIALAQAFEQLVVPAFASGALAPVVHTVMPMSECAAAHTLLESNTTIGKVVLTW